MTTFRWAGPNTGNWQTAANWDDTSDMIDPAGAPPGSLDTVMILSPTTSYQFIDGNGAATSLTLTGDNAFLGTIDAAFVSMPTGTLSIEGGATLDSSLVTTSGTVLVSGAGARLAASNGIEMTGGALTIAGGLFQARSVTLDGIGAILSVAASGTAEIGLVTSSNAIVPAGALSVDAGFTIDVSNQSSIFPSSLLGVVIDNGLITANYLDFGNVFYLSGVGSTSPASSLTGGGTVEATANGTVEFGGQITGGGGALTVQADVGALIGFDDAVAAGAKVTLSGGDVVRIGAADADALISFGATVSGFDGTDVLLVQGGTITSTAFHAGVGGAAGTLSLLDGAQTVDTVLLAGSFAGQGFSAYTVGSGTTEIVMSPAAAAGSPSPGTAGADRYLWIGPLAGDWNTAADWIDSTAMQNPAAVAPGSLDLATFDSPASVFQVVAGSGSAASIAFNGENLISGTISAGTLTNSGSLEVAAGGALTANQATLSDDLAVLGNGAALNVTGSLTLNEGTLLATGGGVAQLAAATLGGIAVSTGIVVDAQSAVEIGAAGGAAVGALSVDAGATLEVSNSSSIFPATILGAVILDGLLSAAQLDLGNEFFQAGTAFDGPASSLAGSGSLDVAAGGTVEVGGAVLAGGLSFDAAGQSTLRFDGAVAAGNAVTLQGAGDVVQIDAAGAQALSGFAASISGFDASDVLVLNGGAFTGASYAAGTLNVLSDGATAQSILLPGFSDGQSFEVVPIGRRAAEIVLAPAAQPPAESGGSAGADHYVWIGPIAGTWGTAGNWEDATLRQTPAVVAPGSLDIVTIDNPASAFRVVAGAGRSASIAFAGDNIVLGDIAGGPVSNSGSLVIGAGGTLTAASVTTANLSASGAGATLDASGALTLSIGVLAANDGGSVFAGSANLSGLSTGVTVDAASLIEIGAAGRAATGALSVDAGATLTVSNTGSITPSYILGGLIVNGLLTAAELDIGNKFFFAGAAASGPLTSVSGSGTIEARASGTVEFGVSIAASSLDVQVDPGALVRFDASVGAGVSITLAGGGDIVQIGSSGAASDIGFGATISGFGSSDIIVATGAHVTGTNYRAGVGGAPGTLTLLSAGGPAQSINLLGDYSGQDFVIASGAANATQVSLVTACFAKGVRIATPSGGVAVEKLRIGDNVLTSAGLARDVIWIGRRTLHCGRHPRPQDVLPVRVRKDAFGGGKPERDLLLSPDHAVFVNGRLIPIRYLINGASVVQEQVEKVSYFHVELASHDVILAEGLEVESYLDTGNRAAFANGGKLAKAHPDFARAVDPREVWAHESCAELVVGGPEAAAAKHMLLRRLPSLGFGLTEDPGLEVLIDGAPAKIRVDGLWIATTATKGARTMTLRSRVAAPAEVDPASDDWRRLGVAAAAVRLDGATVALDDPRLAAGWRDPEPELRWTDGCAELNVEGAALVEIALPRGLLKYPVAPPPRPTRARANYEDALVRPDDDDDAEVRPSSMPRPKDRRLHLVECNGVERHSSPREDA